jgi:hypothetical protein
MFHRRRRGASTEDTEDTEAPTEDTEASTETTEAPTEDTEATEGVVAVNMRA